VVGELHIKRKKCG